MDQASISRIEEWDSRPVSGGYVGLNELAADEFTGVVTGGGTRLVMLNGRVVGVFDGAIEDFSDGQATAYQAPDPGLPLLLAMWERDGEVRGQYYTDDTPIQEVDDTLASGGFTGYLELSENVLSGDYYVVYYGGRSLAVAFVGNNRRVVTGDEAFDLAADEVGIYEVRAVDIEVSDVPEAPDAPGAAGAGAGGDVADAEEPGEPEAAVEPESGAASDAAEADQAAADDPEADEAVGDDAAPADVADLIESVEEPGAESGDESEAAEEEAPTATGNRGEATAAEGPDDEEAVTEAEPAADHDGPTDGTTEPEDAEADGTSGGSAPAADSPDSRAEAGGSAPRAPPEPTPGEEPDERFEEEARWREARTVPALDPDESEPPAEEREASPAPAPEPGREEAAGSAPAELQDRLRRLESELESSERERRELTARLEEALDASAGEDVDRSALQERIEELESRLEAAQSGGGAPAADSEARSGRAVDPETALDQTDLFVRYRSKGEATLETAKEGRADREEVAQNLRIETHSRFESEGATVAGQPFAAYLSESIHYRFVAWLIEEFLYEIQETGSESALRGLYEVLPDVDRAEFNGTVTGRDEEGEEVELGFDVVCRDRMGKPLILANINDSLDPASGDMLGNLVTDATAAAESHESIGAAFYVTASFYEPDALETVADATRGGGLLSRDSKKSFVKLSRSGGYHLCLVEARGEDFHVVVPDF